jgi:hypothetical protein
MSSGETAIRNDPARADLFHSLLANPWAAVTAAADSTPAGGHSRGGSRVGGRDAAIFGISADIHGGRSYNP